MTATPSTVRAAVARLNAESPLWPTPKPARPARLSLPVLALIDADTRAALERVAAMDSHELTLSAFDSLLASV